MFPKELVIYLIEGEILAMAVELTGAEIPKQAPWSECGSLYNKTSASALGGH